MTIVRQDEQSIYVIAGGYRARPGNVGGYDHAFDMSDGGLKKGDVVKARHVACSQLTKIRLSDGRMLHWHHHNDQRRFREALTSKTTI